MNKKAQVSIEFIIVIGIVLLISLFFAQTIFGTTDINKSVARIKLRTLEIFSAYDSTAQLDKITYHTTDNNLILNLYIKKNNENIVLSEDDYHVVTESLKRSTNFNNIKLEFAYIN